MEGCHLLFKLLLVAQPIVGKSCICQSFSYNRFNEKYSQSILVEFGSTSLTINEKTIMLQIWDLAGQLSFGQITMEFYKGTIGAIYVFDLTSRKSFQNVLNCHNDILTQTHECCLVGNKLDLEKQRQVTAEEAQDFAQKHNMTYFEISAKTRQNLDKPFQFVAQRILERIDKKELDYTNKLGIQMGQYFQNKDEQNNSEMSKQFEKQEQAEQPQQPEQFEEPEQLRYEQSDDPKEKISQN